VTAQPKEYNETQPSKEKGSQPAAARPYGIKQKSGVGILALNLTTCENPKPKFLNPKQSRKLKLENGFVSPIFGIEPHLNLLFVSDFEFRNSNFP
jgi:hypothetical protein